jgi:hypothetical protein
MKNTQRKLSDLDNRINRARLAGAMRGHTTAEFKNFLLDLGLNKYEKSILPIETAQENPPQEQPCTMGKIIPFPGVSLSKPDSFQDGLDDFLQEMGYIE